MSPTKTRNKPQEKPLAGMERCQEVTWLVDGEKGARTDRQGWTAIFLVLKKMASDFFVPEKYPLV
jgi:hypothetical protein